MFIKEITIMSFENYFPLWNDLNTAQKKIISDNLITQNVKKGTKGIMNLLEQEEQNALEERKNLAKKYGEEATTKLLGPMMILLLIIMLIIMIPAFMSF